MAVGLAIPRPAMSGAEPCAGSKIPGPESARLADGASPRPPVTAAARSLRMSPNMFSVTITSNCSGVVAICIAALSTSMCSTLTSGNSGAISFTTRRHIRDVSRTFALSMDVSAPRRDCARANALRATRSTWLGWYSHVSYTVPSSRTPLAPK